MQSFQHSSAFTSTNLASHTATQQRLNDVFDILIDQCRFTLAFRESFLDPRTDAPEPSRMDGVTLHDRNGCVYTYISVDLVLPLLRNDLSNAERMGAQWNVANTCT